MLRITVRLFQKDMIIGLVISRNRYATTNNKCGGRDGKSSDRNGISITVQGVLGELALFLLLGLNTSDLENDTEFRSEKQGTDKLKDAHNVLPNDAIVTVDVKTILSKHSRCNFQIHVTPNKETDRIEHFDETTPQTRKKGNAELKNSYALMWIQASKEQFDDMCMQYFKMCENQSNDTEHQEDETKLAFIPEFIDVQFVGWIEANQLWAQCGGRLTDVTSQYTRQKSTTDKKIAFWRFVSKELSESWNDFEYYWFSGKLKKNIADFDDNFDGAPPETKKRKIQ